MISQQQVEFAVIEARHLSAQGRYRKAMLLLIAIGDNNLPPTGLDLLARLSLEGGEVGRSRDLWARALRIDPSFKVASDALVMLNSPWILYGIVKRGLQLVGTAFIVVLVTLGLLSLFYQ